ncbi:hypothetical protein AGMMS49545_22600 [Betaproteobacteria bacterium]|nr:hypothetical protein AGMMS49545_22600 [Betaproteobacteria bacterium]GHU47402.1 hypothetical protein AGMMS50289_22530 [Betaproteobacteria bacterium]
MMFIDPPERAAPLEQWYAFLDELRSDPRQDDESIIFEIRNAEKVLAWRATVDLTPKVAPKVSA